MRLTVIIFLFTTLLMGQNPKVYSALGDVIYDNVEKIEDLKNVSQYKKYNNKISSYVLRVNGTKKIGFKIESGDKNYDSKEYLQTLRDLSKENDFFLRSVEKNFEKSIEQEDSELFIQMINSGLLNIEENKSEIKKYYLSNSRNINASGVMKTFIDKEITKKQKKKSRIKKLTKKQIQEARIKRIREKDRIKQENIKKSLEEKAMQKKMKIRQMQKKELDN